MKSVQDLKNEFDQLGQSDYLAMIKFYESNLDAINRIELNRDAAHYDAKMRLQSEYGMSLVRAGYYSQATSFLKDSISMFENASSIDSSKLYSITYFEHVLWNYGVALWETRQVPQAKVLFERLVKHYPENEKYKAWLNGLKTQRLKKISNVIAVIIALMFIGEFTVFDKLENKNQIILAVTELLLVLSYVMMEIYIYLLNKKKKTN